MIKLYNNVSKIELKEYKMKNNRFNRYNRLNEVLNHIDESIGFGPDDELSEETDIDLFIENFLEKAKKYKIYEDVFTIITEDESKSILEMLNDI